MQRPGGGGNRFDAITSIAAGTGEWADDSHSVTHPFPNALILYRPLHMPDEWDGIKPARADIRLTSDAKALARAENIAWNDHRPGAR